MALFTRDKVIAALEGIVALVLTSVASGIFASFVKERLGDGVSAPAAALGLAKLAGVVFVICGLYSRRFAAPTASAGEAAKYCWQCLVSSVAPARLGPLLRRPAVLALLALHAAQAAYAIYHFTTSNSGDDNASPIAPSSAAASCLSSTAVFWAPAWEEAVFRYLLFYLVLQRSAGDALFATFSAASVFGAIHLGNLFAGGFTHAVTLLQVITAVACGALFSLLFANTGSVGIVTALHVANNAAASVWLGLEGAASGASDCPAQPAPTPALLASVTAQMVVVCGAAALEGRALLQLLSGVTTSTRFRDIHPLVYKHAVPAAQDGDGAAPAAVADAPAPAATAAAKKAQ